MNQIKHKKQQMMNSTMLTNESGRSMVEMLGVLAFIGVLSVAGIAGYFYAMNKYRADELINEANIRANSIAMQLASGKDPDQVTLNEFGNAPIAGTTLSYEPFENINDQFTITIGNLDKGVCKIILNSILDGSLIQNMVDEDGNEIDCDADSYTDVFLVYNTDMSNSPLSQSDMPIAEPPVPVPPPVQPVACISYTADSCFEESSSRDQYGCPIWTPKADGSSCKNRSGTYSICESGACKLSQSDCNSSSSFVVSSEAECNTCKDANGNPKRDFVTIANKTYCAPICGEGEFHGEKGNCTSCSSTDSAITNNTECYKCKDASGNQIRQIFQLNSCGLINCGEGKIHDFSGSCYSCDSESSFGAYRQECSKCKDASGNPIRGMFVSYFCGLNDCGYGKFSDSNGNCRPCSAYLVVGATETECNKCATYAQTDPSIHVRTYDAGWCTY